MRFATLSITEQESVVLAQESGRISRRGGGRVGGEQFPGGDDLLNKGKTIMSQVFELSALLASQAAAEALACGE